jgi:hypothetical protein
VKTGSSPGVDVLLRVALSALVLGTVMAVAVRVEAAEPIEFNRDIRPILADNCFGCHGPDSAPQGKSAWTAWAAIKAAALVRKPDESELVTRVFETEPARVMPPRTKKTLSPQQRPPAAGSCRGEYQPHWSFLPDAETVAVPVPQTFAVGASHRRLRSRSAAVKRSPRPPRRRANRGYVGSPLTSRAFRRRPKRSTPSSPIPPRMRTPGG